MKLWDLDSRYFRIADQRTARRGYNSRVARAVF
jgi:hypothetical protein